jgi:hypothetical protein
MNVDVSRPLSSNGEFHVTLRKCGEPRVSHPGAPSKEAVGGYIGANALAIEQELAHAKKAFAEAVVVQEQLKKTVEILQNKGGFLRSLREWVHKKVSA